MSIKLLGGVAKGFSLATPHESITRPTSVLLKRRLFDYFQDLSGYHFFDLCAGSGSIGLEAISRGAQSVTFVENNFKAFKVLKINTTNFNKKFTHSLIKCFKKNFLQFLEKDFFLKNQNDQEQESVILFFDPPYENKDMYHQFFDCLKRFDFKGLAIVEACKQKTMSEKEFIQKFGEPDRNYQQGTSFLFLYDYNKH